MCIKVVAGIVFAVSALVLVAAIRLMEGPVDLDFLKHRLAQAADVPGNDIKPEIQRIALEWGGISQPMRLVFSGIRFVKGEHQVIATIPTASVTFDARDVLQGMFLPTTVTIEAPTIEADITRDGGMLRRVFTSTDAESQGEALVLLIEQLMAEPNYNSLIGQLDMILIERAKVTIRDVKTGLTWTAPSARGRLKRDAAGVSMAASARLTGNAGHWVDVSLSGVYTRDRSRISLDAAVDGFRPSLLAELSPDVALLRGVDIALSGRLHIEADGHGDVRSVGVDITGGNGRVTLPGVLPASHMVKSVNASATVDATTHTAKIDRVDIDFGATKVSITGAGERKAEGQSFSGRAEVRQIPVDRLGDYWPLEFAPGGREWAVANLSKGEIDVAAEFALSAPGNDMAALKIDRLVGVIDYRGMKVRYMPHMPELEGVSGNARYEGGTLHFDVASGTAVGLKTAGATIDLTGLDGPSPQHAAIRMPITGSAQDVIRFLARPKLGLPKEMLYDYRRLGGEVAVDVSIGFPLLNALAVADLDLKAEASLTHFSLQDAIGDADLSDATARIKYGSSELSVSGTGKLEGNVVEIGWRELFGPKAAFRRRYDLKGTLSTAAVAKAGFPSPEPYLSGPVGTTLSYQVATNGTGEVVGRFDIKAAKAEIVPLDWTKQPGTEGQVQMTMKLAAGGKLTTLDFDARANGLSGKGQVRFTGDNALQQITVNHIKIGQTDVAGDWKRAPGGVEVSLRGPILELPRVHTMIKARDDLAAKDPAGTAAQGRSSTKFTLQIQQLLTKRGTLGYVNGTLALAGDRIAAADLSIGAGKGSTFRVTPQGQGRKLFFYVANFGQLLSDAGWLDGLVDGYLHIEGLYNDAVAGSPLDGFLKLGPYRLQRVTGPRANIGTLNTAIDGLNRAGNALQQFDNLEAKIHKTGDRIHIKNGRTSGQSIGLTTQGFVDLGNDTAKLAGIVVPAFALNNLLSNVPLLGPLLTGGKDGGLFAVAYQLSGPLDDLKTDVNYMSAMTPGALRELFISQPDVAQPPPSPEMQRAP
ncbi:hypothetical protein RSO01_08570 [Reyranella soli]|uniref:YhdP central domain-containing protein n=1 Tax=Reyranella soli TaxID=1230389 RepID=A0A512N4X0_9HYPH|nr:hypothetical protein RSO01_08570 [Reyranella soli]